MRLLLLLVVLAVPADAKKDLKWVPAVVESSSSQRVHSSASEPYGGATPSTVRESLYLDAGAWLYHVTQYGTAGHTLHLREGARVEVAEDGKQLVIRVNGKQHKLHIEERSRGKSPAK
jgi:hypothetical protein